MNLYKTIKWILFLIATLVFIQSCDKAYDSLSTPDTSYEIQKDLQVLADSLEIRKFIEESSDELYGMMTYSAWENVHARIFFRVDSSFYAFNKSTKKSSLGRETYFRQLDRDQWNTVKSMYEEFDFWDEPIFKVPTSSFLDGYTMYVIGKNQKISKKMRIVCRSNPQYDKIGSLGDHLWDFEQYAYENDTLNRRLGYFKPLEL